MMNIFRYGKKWYPMKSGESTVVDMLELKFDKATSVSHNESQNKMKSLTIISISFIS